MPGRADNASPAIFHTYQTRDGLSHNKVWCSVQDSRGFIWFGTENGLTRYEGSSSRSYYHSAEDPSSLGDDCVHALMADGADLWIGTPSGVYIYHSDSDSFERFSARTKYSVRISCDVRRIVRLSDGNIWIATLGQGIFIYEPSSGSLSQINGQKTLILDFCESEDGMVYASAVYSDVLAYSLSGEFLGYQGLISHSKPITIYTVCSFNGHVWAGADSALYCYNPTTRTHRQVSLSGNVQSIYPMGSEAMLVGTSKGLYQISVSTFEVKELPLFQDIPAALGTTGVNAIMQDAENTLWVLTTDSGSCYMPLASRAMNYYKLASGPQLDRVHCFLEKPNGSVIVGADSGIWTFDPVHGSISKHVDIQHVTALASAGEQLWVGTSGHGLYRLDRSGRIIRNYRYTSGKLGSIPSDDILCLYLRKDGTLMIGTAFGLYCYAPEFDSFTPRLGVGSMSAVNNIEEDGEGNLWVSTLTNGQYVNNSDSSSWKNIGVVYNGETTTNIGAVLSSLVGSDGRVWLGLDGKGLCLYNKVKDRLEVVTSLTDDLRKEAVYSIEEDRQGGIWMVLENRLVVLGANGTVRTYDNSDVLRGGKFTSGATLRTSDGNMLFGDASGFYYFSPERLSVNDCVPPVYITEHELVDKDFTAKVATLSFVSPHKNKCRYRLVGYDSSWIVASPGVIEYRKLSHGNYRFEVYGQNEDGIESSSPAVYSFTIERPFWASTLAIFLYLLVFVGIVFVVMLLWNKHIAELYRKRAEEEAQAREQEAAQAKIRFFVSLVHEIRTPLSLIVLPLEKLRESIDSDDKNLRIIDKNVDYLLNVANQLLDFKTMDCDFVPLPKLMEDVQEIVSEGEPSQPAIRDDSFTVLVVDDNPALVDFEAASLSQWYKVEKAMSGEQALKVLSEKEINLVVSDVMMPGITGVELCRAILADINTSHIPVLLLTAKVDLNSKVEGLEAGAVAYIEKPFTIKQLHLQIDNIKSIRRDFGSRAVLNDFAEHTGLNPSDYAFLTQQDLAFIRKVNAIIDERSKVDGCSVDKVAELVGMSTRNFNRKMNTIFSMTPNKYILKYKMHMAKRMLDEGNRPGEVSAALNFSTTSYFAKCFKDEFGVNPKEYQSR